MRSKSFDAVQFMREVRAKMGQEMLPMSFEQRRAYIERKAEVVRREMAPEPQRTQLARPNSP